MRERIEAGLSALGIAFPSGAPDTLAEYGRVLLEQNKVMNLTAILDPEQVASLHFLDSAALLGAVELQGKSFIDVGTGAGFPGLVLKILVPSLRLTLLDGLGKRLTFLSELCTHLGLQDVTLLHARAEEQSLLPGFRDSFDFAAARAVAPLNLLCELCLPFVAAGGHFLAMKSVNCGQELADAQNALKLLSSKVISLYDYSIPGTDVTHRAVIIEKSGTTPRGYPRRFSKIQKSPL